MTNNVYEKITQNIIEALERGVVPWRRPWTITAAPPANLVTRKPYRGINALTTWSAGYASPWWLGWCQVQGFGGRIRRGERATTIVFFTLLDSGRRPAGGDERVSDAADEVAEQEERRTAFVRYSHVWNLAQTEGLEAPAPDTDDRAVTTPNARAEALIEAWSDKPSIRHGFRRAAYSPGLDEIRLPPHEDFVSDERYYATLFHECIHATGLRLGRFGRDVTLPPFGSEDYSKEELVAELGAAFLCGATGIAVEVESSAAYLDSWLSALRRDRQMLVRAAAQAQRAADLIRGVSAESDTHAPDISSRASDAHSDVLPV